MNGAADREIFYPDETFRIRAAIFEVNSRMGPGFLEAVYQECLAIEFAERQIPFVAMPNLALRYRGRTLQATYKPDFICFDKIILELKAVADIANLHKAQTRHYLKATGLRLGLLVNFNHHPKADIVRIVL
jgi:GxxExxY protein